MSEAVLIFNPSWYVVRDVHTPRAFERRSAHFVLCWSREVAVDWCWFGSVLVLGSGLSRNMHSRGPGLYRTPSKTRAATLELS